MALVADPSLVSNHLKRSSISSDVGRGWRYPLDKPPVFDSQEMEGLPIMFAGTDSFSKTSFLLERAMDASLVRRSAIADNISNVDTPYFKRGEVTFESQLKRALDSEARDPMPAKLTNERHIPFRDPIDVRGVRARIQIEHETNYRNDKNNVDIEKEIIDATKNMLMYNAMAQRVSGGYRLIGMLTR